MIINFHPLSTENTSGNSVSTDIGNLAVGTLFVDVQAVSGTLPTLVVKIQHSPNGSTWYDITGLVTASLVNVTTTSISLTGLVPLSDHIRCVWTLGGASPNFTFTADLAVHSI